MGGWPLEEVSRLVHSLSQMGDIRGIPVRVTLP